MFLIPHIAYAASPASEGAYVAWQFVQKINEVILFPLITLMMGVAVLYFMYGGFQYILHSDAEAARAEGRKNMMWGIIGLLVMLSAYALLALAANLFGLDNQLSCADNPALCDVPDFPGGP